MKRLIVFPLTVFFLLSFYYCSNQKDYQVSDSIKLSLRADAVSFTETLRSILLKEIQTNGLPAAVSVCSDTAQILTKNIGLSKGIYIKRVSFNNRNPNDYPDEFEAKALKYFEDMKANGKLNDSTEYIEINESNGIKSVRYLKPILIQAPCLNCHGQKENIIPEVMAIIDQKYPNDKATGYNLKDLRGAISIKKVL